MHLGRSTKMGYDLSSDLYWVSVEVMKGTVTRSVIWNKQSETQLPTQADDVNLLN